MAFRTRRLMMAPALLILSACGGDGDGEAGAPEAPGTSATVASGLQETSDVPDGAQAISFLGDTLTTPELPDAVRETYMARYAEAEDDLAADPNNGDALIWMGRRTAYLGQFRAAIDIFTHAMTLHPEDARLYRHRGHRYLTVREPSKAIADFERAVELIEGTEDEVEPDGLPNAMNTPTSTLHFNIWYHLGLAHYLRGDFEAAEEAYEACLDVSVHPDSVVATTYWLYLTLRRLGKDQEAAALLEGIDEDMEIIESTAYLDLLLLFKGERTLEDLAGPDGGQATLQGTTMAYGIGAWHLVEGRLEEAEETFRSILEGRSQWSAFGYQAAEAELARGATER